MGMLITANARVFFFGIREQVFHARLFNWRMLNKKL